MTESGCRDPLATRDAILEAVAFAAETVLRSQEWSAGIQAVLDRLGKATGVSRAYIFENGEAEGELHTSQRHEWVAEGVDPEIDNPELQEVPWRATGFEEWYEPLAEGRPVVGAPDEFSPAVRGFLEAQEILSIVVVPILVQGRLWGFAGFDDCATARRWSRPEVDALATAARLIAATLERARMEAELERRAERLRRATRMEAIGRLAGGIAHDFNNLLTAIRGYADLLGPAVGGRDEPRGHLDQIAGAAERGGRLIQQLLAYSRRQSLQPRAVDLNEAVEEMGDMLQRLMGADIVLETELAGDLDAVRVDPGQLDQILLNLAVNARDAMPSGGRWRLETRNVRLDEPYADGNFVVPPGSWVCLEVKDEGVGMDAETREHAFDPFFTTKGATGGTGMGLATVYGIVKQSGGFIWLYSEPGEGTRFRIFLSPHDGPVARERPAEPAPSRGGDETLLVVDDDRAVRRLVVIALRRAGYDVIEAGDAEEAIAEFDRLDRRLDLLLTDLVMPGGGGERLAEEIHRRAPHVPVLVTSGLAPERIQRGPIDRREIDGTVNFLAKPYTLAELERCVRQVLDGTWRGRPAAP